MSGMDSRRNSGKVQREREFWPREHVDDATPCTGLVVLPPNTQVAKAIAVHKDADACHPANGVNVFDGQPWSSVGVSAGAGDLPLPKPERDCMFSSFLLFRGMSSKRNCVCTKIFKGDTGRSKT